LITRERTLDYYNTVSASIGFQLGAQARSVIIVFMTEEALHGFRRVNGWNESALAALVRSPRAGLISAGDPFTVMHRALIIRLAERHRVPAIYQFRQFAVEGGLMSYGPDTHDIFRRSASYVEPYPKR
jgi:hypothetical protein